MKRLIIVLLSLLIVGSCGPTKRIIEPVVDDIEVYSSSASYMYFTMNKILGKSQVDSMIVVDHLTPLDEWIWFPIGSGKSAANQYIYIKSLEEDNELIYTAIQMEIDTLYKCTKRITEKVQY